MERRNKRIVECRFFFVILFESQVFFLIVGVEALHGVSVEGRFMTSQVRIDLKRSVRAEEEYSAIGATKTRPQTRCPGPSILRRGLGEKAPAAKGCGQKRTPGKDKNQTDVSADQPSSHHKLLVGKKR
jgi:hypothetical protein